MCSNSWKRCNWAFYIAACTFDKGIICSVHFLIKYTKNICVVRMSSKSIGLLILRRKSQKSEMNIRTFIGRQLASGGSSFSNGNKTTADPLLLPFLCNLPFVDPKTTDKQDEPISSNSSNAKRYFIIKIFVSCSHLVSYSLTLLGFVVGLKCWMKLIIKRGGKKLHSFNS